MSDLEARLNRLRRKLASTDDPDDRADLEAAIAALQQQAVVEEALPPRIHTQHIREYTSIQAAVAGDVHGDIYIVGERAESARVLLAGYLRWLASQCGQLPLRGVREQKAATDVLNISLDQVYTQLATEIMVVREMFAGQALQRFDAQAYVRTHVDDLLLPGQQRRIMAVTPAQRDRRADQAIGMSQRRDGLDLRTLPIDELARAIQGATDVTFYGPQLVTEAIAASPRMVLLGEPGSGKSTALRYLALTLAHAGLDATLDLSARLEGWQTLGDHGRLIPLFMPL